jgi:hypothetical protein
MQLFCWFPGVVTLGVSFPFEEISESFVLPELLMCSDVFDLVLCFALDEVRWWSREVWAVRVHFNKRGKE